MSLSYAESLSYFPHKGKVGMRELSEKSDDLKIKLEKLEQIFRESHHIVAITGAGISTAAGIPDFRGPKGVWTLEKRGEKPSFNVSFDQAEPTYTHRALCTLEKNNYLHFVISQNIDGLHHRSGLPMERLAELHGNVFSEECEACHTQVIRQKSVGSYCRKRTGNVCNSMKSRNKNLSCRGKLRDTVLDWEDPLPELALNLSEQHCAKADLCLCLGTSLQIRPCRDLPKKTKKNGGKLVIINLQKTSLDSLADLIIHERCDIVMKYILEKLNLNIDEKPTSFNVSKYSHVRRIILLCGKSKSGRDFIGRKLSEQLFGILLHVHESLKVEPGNLNKDNTSNISQENTIKCDEEKSHNDPTVFCRMMLEKNDQLCLSCPIWIISDIRSYAEIEVFKQEFNERVIIVRIEASNETREKRGWNPRINTVEPEFESQSDNNTQWSFVFSNNDQNNFNEQMNDLIKLINS